MHREGQPDGGFVDVRGADRQGELPVAGEGDLFGALVAAGALPVDRELGAQLRDLAG